MADGSDDARKPLVAFQCPDELKRTAEDLAHEDRISVSELMRRLVTEESERRKHDPSGEAVPA